MVVHVTQVSFPFEDASTEGITYDNKCVIWIDNAGADGLIPVKVEYPKLSGNKWDALLGIDSASIPMNYLVLPCPPHCNDGKEIDYEEALEIVAA